MLFELLVVAALSASPDLDGIEKAAVTARARELALAGRGRPNTERRAAVREGLGEPPAGDGDFYGAVIESACSPYDHPPEYFLTAAERASMPAEAARFAKAHAAARDPAERRRLVSLDLFGWCHDRLVGGDRPVRLTDKDRECVIKAADEACPLRPVTPAPPKKKETSLDAATRDQILQAAKNAAMEWGTETPAGRRFLVRESVIAAAKKSRPELTPEDLDFVEGAVEAACLPYDHRQTPPPRVLYVPPPTYYQVPYTCPPNRR